MRVAKVVSGGQTGADRGGLEASQRCGVPTGGWVPHGRRAEDGALPDRCRNLRETAEEELAALHS
jgi:hypothetical protein